VVPYSKKLTVISATIDEYIEPATERIVAIGPADEIMPRYIKMCEDDWPSLPIGTRYLWTRGLSQRATGTGWF
jgi:hypothetical protein